MTSTIQTKRNKNVKQISGGIDSHSIPNIQRRRKTIKSPLLTRPNEKRIIDLRRVKEIDEIDEFMDSNN
jgi:ABC-type transporter Mla MlaB component